ncbi:hypothetical protein IFM89_028309 [Coptis chinensis]|uniref:F-box protein n=1 Tax=Coptis chinensis TaxID=261450 RepID=A0A835I6B8_9MAGN|nr:hypothetical protein IFM89_028309 [Coptis chinensis]
MNILPCLSWVPFLCTKVHELFTPQITCDRDLPYEIIADILSRLPAECIFLCGRSCKPLRALTRTPFFVGMHLNRATPLITFQYYSTYFDIQTNSCVREITINFTDGVTRNIVSKSIKIDLTLAPGRKDLVPVLYGSYNGFLLFKILDFDSVLFLLNPITQEQVSVVPHCQSYFVRGFFFHSTAKEYRVLYVAMKGNQFEFVILSLMTKSSRFITRSSYPPTGLRSPTIVNGVLHWMISDASYMDARGFNPSCENSIVTFDIYSEEVSTLPHPGGQCGLRKEHHRMKLMEKDGHLCFCDDLSNCGKIVIWMLEDYKNKVWVTMRVVTFGAEPPSYMFSCVQSSCERHRRVEALLLYRDELLLRASYTDLFLHHTIRATTRSVDNESNLNVAAVVHINTLASLHTDKIIFLLKEENSKL